MIKKSKLGPRQLHTLAELPHREMLDEIAIGLPIIVRSSNELSAAADTLPDDHGRAREILALHAEEEAAKAAMLVDMVRCPPARSDDLKRLGKQLSDHLARLIYADSCTWRPADFAAVRRAVAGQRHEFYLDGPETGSEFIMRNRLIQRREGLLYADRFRWEHGYEWHEPRGSIVFEVFKPLRPAVALMNALAAVNAFDRRGLAIIHDIWASIEITNNTSWHENKSMIGRTLDSFEKMGWLNDVPEEFGPTLWEWPMPMYALDCRMIRIDTDELAARRSAEYWAE